MKEWILARTQSAAAQTLKIGEKGLVLDADGREKLLFSGEIEAAHACLDASLLPCAVLVSEGQLHFVGTSGVAVALTPKSQGNARWLHPFVCDVTGIAAVCLMRDGAAHSLLIFRQMGDGTFRGRRILSGTEEVVPLGLYCDPPGARLYLGRARGGILHVTSLDPLSETFTERVEFSVPEPAESLQFVRHENRWHYACLAGGTLFADGVPLDSGAKEVCLYPDAGGLVCGYCKGEVYRTCRLTSSGWVKEASKAIRPGEVIRVLAPQGSYCTRWEYPAPEPSLELGKDGGGEYHKILSNQALLLRTLREKQELQQRTLFTLQAKIDAQAAQLERLRRRCEALETALEALEAVYRGART